MNIHEVVKLSELLAEMEQIKRITKLPNGEFESDSHHSFSLALIAYQIVAQSCPELNPEKVMLYALCHDLLEIVTGDDVTLHFTAKQHAEKFQKERNAIAEFDDLFRKFPDLKNSTHKYERLDTPEAATIFVLDKACTTWTYHAQGVSYAHDKSLHTKRDVDKWAETARNKFASRSKADPPQAILDVFEESHRSLRNLIKE